MILGRLLVALGLLLPLSVSASAESVLDQDLNRVLWVTGHLREIGDISKAEELESKLIDQLEKILSAPGTSREKRIRALSDYQKIKRAQFTPESVLKGEDEYKAEIARRQTRYMDVINWARRLKDGYPEKKTAILMIEAEVRHLYANSFALTGDIDRSLYEYGSLLNEDLIDGNWKAFCKMKMALLHLKKGEDEKALYLYDRIIQENASLRDWPACARFHRAEYYQNMGDMTKAREELRRLVADYPSSVWAGMAKEELEASNVEK